MYNRDQMVACQKLRELFVRDPPVGDALEQRRGDEDEARTRLRQTPVDFSGDDVSPIRDLDKYAHGGACSCFSGESER